MALDIDFPAAKSCCQSYVLTFFADSQRKLIIRDYYCRRFFFLVDQYFFYLCRAENVLNQDVRIIIPCRDVDLFSEKFIDDILDTASACADTRSYRIHILIFCVHGDRRSGTSLSGNALDLYRAVFDFRHFQFKELFYKSRMCS